MYQWEDPDPKLFDEGDHQDPVDPAAVFLTQAEVYKYLTLRTFDYGPHFHSLFDVDLAGGARGGSAW